MHSGSFDKFYNRFKYAYEQKNLSIHDSITAPLQEIFTVSFQHSADLTNSSFGIRKKLELNSIQKIK